FCVRCGESLQDVTLTGAPAPTIRTTVAEAAAEAAAEASQPEPVDEQRAREEASNQVLAWMGTIGALVLLVGAAAVVQRYRANERRPDPSAFSFPAPSMPLPPAQPFQPRAGEARLLSGRQLMWSQDSKSAVKELAQAVSENPNDPDIRFAFAQALWMSD